MSHTSAPLAQAMPAPPIEMVDLKTQYRRLQPEIDAALSGVLTQAAFIQGPDVVAFAHELGAYLSGAHVIPCANGTDALQLAMMAYEWPAGAEVIVPSFNYVAAAETAALLGLVPVFVDVDPDSYQIDPNTLAGAVSPRTVAVVAVHLFGQCAPLAPIAAFCQAHGLNLIEDNAQAIGADYLHPEQGAIRAGLVGQVATTSFFPSKNLGAYGDGGALYTKDAALAQTLRQLANHGQASKYVYHRVGVNSRLDTLQAALLRVKLRHIQAFIEARQVAAAAYDTRLSGLTGLTVPYRRGDSTHVFHQYVLKLEGGAEGRDRDALRTFLQERGIPTMIYYPEALHRQAAFAGGRSREGSALTHSEALCRQVLALPMHTELTEGQLDDITGQIQAFMRAGA